MTTTAKKKVSTVSKKPNTTTLRKGVKKEIAMVCAAGEECFWSNDGKVLSSLSDLLVALTHMSPETYIHHVTPDRNDFADWVEFVLIDKKCADALRKAKDQKAAIAHISKKFPSYKK